MYFGSQGKRDGVFFEGGELNLSSPDLRMAYFSARDLREGFGRVLGDAVTAIAPKGRDLTTTFTFASGAEMPAREALQKVEAALGGATICEASGGCFRLAGDDAMIGRALETLQVAPELALRMD